MALDIVPREIFHRIVDTALASSTWSQGLRLRLVNRKCSLEISFSLHNEARIDPPQVSGTAKSMQPISIEQL